MLYACVPIRFCVILPASNIISHMFLDHLDLLMLFRMFEYLLDASSVKRTLMIYSIGKRKLSLYIFYCEFSKYLKVKFGSH